jgi:hypothetical protein
MGSSAGRPIPPTAANGSPCSPPDGDRTLRQARLTRNDLLRRTLFSATSAAERRTLQRVWQRLATPQRERVPTLKATQARARAEAIIPCRKLRFEQPQPWCSAKSLKSLRLRVATGMWYAKQAATP